MPPFDELTDEQRLALLEQRSIGNGDSFESIQEVCPVTFARDRYTGAALEREGTTNVRRAEMGNHLTYWASATRSEKGLIIDRAFRYARKEAAWREIEQLHIRAIEEWRTRQQLGPNEIDASAGVQEVDDLDHLTAQERAVITEVDTSTAFGGTEIGPRIRLEEGASIASYSLTRTPTGIECDFTLHPRVAAWLRKLAIKCHEEGHAQRTVRNLKTSEQNIEVLDGGSTRVWEINRSDIVTRNHHPNLRLDTNTSIENLGWIRLTAGGLHRRIKFTELDDPAYWFKPITTGLTQVPRLQALLNQAFTRLASAYVEVPNVVSSDITISSARRDS